MRAVVLYCNVALKNSSHHPMLQKRCFFGIDRISMSPKRILNFCWRFVSDNTMHLHSSGITTILLCRKNKYVSAIPLIPKILISLSSCASFTSRKQPFCLFCIFKCSNALQDFSAGKLSLSYRFLRSLFMIYLIYQTTYYIIIEKIRVLQV